MNSASVEAIISLVGKRILNYSIAYPTRQREDRTRDRCQAPFLAVDVRLFETALYWTSVQYRAPTVAPIIIVAIDWTSSDVRL
jgi:hypothetical protein